MRTEVNTRGPGAHRRDGRDDLSLEGKGHVPGEERAELVPRGKLCESRWEGGRAQGWKMQSPQRHRGQRGPRCLRGNVSTVVPYGFQNLQRIILHIHSGKNVHPLSTDLTFWSSQNHWELSHVNKLGHWDGCFYPKANMGGGKIMGLTFLCNP